MATMTKYLFGEEPDEMEDGEAPVKPAMKPSKAFMAELERMYPNGAVIEPKEPEDANGEECGCGNKKMMKLMTMLALLGDD